MSLSPKRASQVSLLAEAQSDSIHHLDDRNWSWAYLRVSNIHVFYAYEIIAVIEPVKKTMIPLN